MPIFWKKYGHVFIKISRSFFLFCTKKSRDFIASILQIHAEGIKVVGSSFSIVYNICKSLFFLILYIIRSGVFFSELHFYIIYKLADCIVVIFFTDKEYVVT